MPEYDLDDITTKLRTAVVSDILDQLGITGRVAAPGIVPMAGGRRVAGHAHTLRVVPVSKPPERPYEHLLSAIDRLDDEAVLVIGTEGESSSSLFGGLLTTAVKARAGRGVIIDGPVRDVEELREIGFPVYATWISPLDSAGRDEAVAADVEILVGGVRVKPGDLVFADADGIVFVPAEHETEVVTKALAKAAAEGDVRGALEKGMSATEAFEVYGIL